MRVECWRGILAVSFGVLMLSLSACGTSEDGSGEDMPGDGKQNQASESANGETPLDGSAEDIYQQLLAEFEADEIPAPSPPEESYTARLAEFGEDYSECAEGASVEQRECEKPVSLGNRELKQNINVQLILDASGSMQGEVNGERKIDAARRTLTDFVGTLPESANVSLRVYGHVGSNNEADRERSCAASEIILPFQPLDTGKFTDAINSFEPRGWTPVAGSLEAAREDFAAYDPGISSNFVYMVSDGVETCGGDPVAAARSLAAEDVQAEVNIVGFDVDPEAARQLRQAAESGGGSYFEAGSASELNEVFRERFDWGEWAAYYNCIEGTAYAESNAATGAAYSNSNCITGKAYTESNAITGAAYEKSNKIEGAEYKLYNDISNELYSDTRYEQQRDALLELAEKRRDARIEAAMAERDYSVEQAEERRDGLVEPAEAERDAAVQAAEQERDEVLESAEKGREELDQSGGGR